MYSYFSHQNMGTARAIQQRHFPKDYVLRGDDGEVVADLGDVDAQQAMAATPWLFKGLLWAGSAVAGSLGLKWASDTKSSLNDGLSWGLFLIGSDRDWET